MTRFRYKFDKDLYYAGLAYPIAEMHGNPVYEENTTTKEPFWKDGFIPRFDLVLNNWKMEPRDNRQRIMDVEKEVSNNLMLRFTEEIRLQNADLIYKYSKALDNDLQKMLDHKERFLSEYLHKKFEIINERLIDAQKSRNNFATILNEQIEDSRKYLSPVRTLIKKLITKFILLFDRV